MWTAAYIGSAVLVAAGLLVVFFHGVQEEDKKMEDWAVSNGREIPPLQDIEAREKFRREYHEAMERQR